MARPPQVKRQVPDESQSGKGNKWSKTKRRQGGATGQHPIRPCSQAGIGSKLPMQPLLPKPPVIALAPMKTESEKQPPLTLAEWYLSLWPPRAFPFLHRAMMEQTDEMGSNAEISTSSDMLESGRRSTAKTKVLPTLLVSNAHNLTSNIKRATASISKLGRHQHWREALCFFAKVSEDRCSPDTVLTGAISDACGRSAQWQRSLAMLRWMQPASLQPSCISYSTIAGACAKLGFWQLTLELLMVALQAGVQTDAASYSVSISACDVQSVSNWELPLAILCVMRCCGVALDKIVFVDMMAVCEKTVSWFHALQLMDGTYSYSIEPDAMLYSTAITACGTGTMWHAALELLREPMLCAGLLVNVVTYGAAMSACEKCGRWREALKLLHEMEQRTIQTNMITLNTAMSACGKGEQWALALSLLHDMRLCQLRMNTITCNSVISACEKVSQWTHAATTFTEMQQQHLVVDAVSLNAAITANVNSGLWAHALQLFRSMKRSNMAWTIVTLNTLTTAFQVCFQWTATLTMLRLGKQAGLQQDSITYGTVLAAGATTSRWAASMDLLAEERQNSLKPGLSECNSVMVSHGRDSQWQRSMLLMPLLRASGDVIGYNAAIGSLEVSGRLGDATQIYEEAVASGILQPSKGYDKRKSVIDLHNMSAAVARVALRRELQERVKGLTDRSRRSGGFRIITGQGVHSEGDPVLIEAMRELLVEAQINIPENTEDRFAGTLKVSARELQRLRQRTLRVRSPASTSLRNRKSAVGKSELN